MQLDSLAEIAEQLRKENDRTVAIIAASLIEVQLEKLLSKAMINRKEVYAFFHGFGPLSSFSARASLSLFLGLIPEDIHNDLTYIRKIRNALAHDYQNLDFDRSPICDFVTNLISVKWLVHCMPLADKPITADEEEELRTKPRRKFEMSAAIVIHFLDKYIEAIKEPSARKYEFDWPSLRSGSEHGA